MAVSKKITSKKPIKKEQPVEVKKVVTENKKPTTEQQPAEKKVCYFCKNKVTPTYTDVVTLRKFVNDRAKINPKARSGVCSKHQRAVSKNVKYARHLALLPFVPKV